MKEKQTELIDGISQISVTAYDLERGIEFYRDILGLNFLFDTGNMAFFDCGGIRLMLSLPEKEEFRHQSSIIYFHTQNIDAAYDLLSKKGVRFEDKPHSIAKMDAYDILMVFFRDTEGNMLSLTGEIKNL